MMFRRCTWVKIAAPLVILSVLFLTVAPDFAVLSPAFRTAHRIHLPAVGLPVYLLFMPSLSVHAFRASVMLSHWTVGARLIDLTCSRLC